MAMEVKMKMTLKQRNEIRDRYKKKWFWAKNFMCFCPNCCNGNTERQKLKDAYKHLVQSSREFQTGSHLTESDDRAEVGSFEYNLPEDNSSNE